LTATDTQSAITILSNLPVSAVLVDYKHEGLDAEAVAVHIKRWFPKQPVILLSAFSDLPERVLWLFDEYVLKSEPPERIAALIDQITTIGKKPPSSEQAVNRRAAG